ncbi:16S rRNA (guanine(966)-N(2))-methyltransferase RsmD [Ectothiorhodospiraceae bacterium 2226]|nr:16S rRNA (guanine(966)-N(2))-methyltransferase RsmD [Ectothiorhodospiraceae bacterium 2226]
MRARGPRSSRSAARPGSLRIIAGRWRGRRLPIAEVEGLRPTPDRVRETLFNWLQPVVAGARCLDLYAGSGALGLEALSRGAGLVVMVDSEPRVVAQLRAHVAALGALEQAEVHLASAESYLAGGAAQPFDLVFLDPPFRRDLLVPTCACLEQGGWLAPGARIYLEAEADAPAPALPAGWEFLRAGSAGQVRYYLAVRPGAEPDGRGSEGAV